MAAKISKNSRRLKKKIRIRKKLSGTEQRPRLCVFKSAKHIYAQIIDDIAGKTIAAASTLDGDFLSKFEGGDKTSKAALVGTMVAERACEKGIKTIVFDRGGYIYHGRVKSLADAAREAGLVF